MNGEGEDPWRPSHPKPRSRANPAEPSTAPTEMPAPTPDIDMPDPGASPDPTGPANPS